MIVSWLSLNCESVTRSLSSGASSTFSRLPESQRTFLRAPASGDAAAKTAAPAGSADAPAWAPDFKTTDMVGTGPNGAPNGQKATFTGSPASGVTADSPPAKMQLTADEQAILDGKEGPEKAKLMQILVRFGDPARRQIVVEIDRIAQERPLVRGRIRSLMDRDRTELFLGRAVLFLDADHDAQSQSGGGDADHDRREHDLDHGEIDEQQLAGDHVKVGQPAALEKDPKGNAQQQSDDHL